MIFKDTQTDKFECRNGMVFRHRATGTFYILATVGGVAGEYITMSLISICDANRWNEGIRMALDGDALETKFLTSKEWAAITGNHHKDTFIPVGMARDVVHVRED